MARKNTVAKREVEIAARLRQVRNQNRLSMVAMAETLGINALRYMSYEYGKVPLPFSVAKSIGMEFDSSLRWLATSEGDKEPREPIPPEVEAMIPARASLSLAYDNYLKPLAERYHEDRKKWQTSTEGLSPAEKGLLHRQLLSEFEWLVGQLRLAIFHSEYLPGVEMVRALEKILRDFTTTHPQLIQFLNAPKGAVEPADASARRVRDAAAALKRSLDTFAENSKTEGVRNSELPEIKTLPELLARLRVLTDTETHRGNRSALAGELGVSPSLVTSWLSGKFEPGGAVTLKILQWVKGQEAKPKSPGQATNSTRAAAQRKASIEKKPTSGQRNK